MEKDFKGRLMAYMAGNFSCREIAELVTDFLEGSLTLSERLRFHLHIGMCFACRNYLRQMKYTITTLGELPSEPVPPEVKDELLKRFRNWKKDHPEISGDPNVDELSKG